jgi:hypothetical protein
VILVIILQIHLNKLSQSDLLGEYAEEKGGLRLENFL